MKLNRRNVLLGLGTIATGGGAAFVSGAFTQVDANREVQISVADDSSALLGLVAGDSQFVDAEGGTLGIDISQVNLDGTTTLENAFSIVNNSDTAGGGQAITVGASIADGGEGDTNLTNISEIVQFNAVEFSDVDILGTGETITLDEPGTGGTVKTDITVVIDLSDIDRNDFDGDSLLNEVTFTADGQY